MEDARRYMIAKETSDADAEPDIGVLLGGDRTEFEKLVRKESPRLFRVIVRIVGDAAEAESIMQETCFQALERLNTFRRESKFVERLPDDFRTIVILRDI